MEVYFDKNNLLSFAKSSNRKELFEDCVRMLKKQLDIKCSFSIDDLKPSKEDNEDEKIAKEDCISWLQLMTQDIEGERWKWNMSFPFGRPVQSDAANKFNKTQLSSVYLIDDENIDNLNSCGIIFGSVGSEVELLSSLVFDDYQFVEPIPIREMHNWDELLEYLTPCTDIIWVDKYIFGDESLYNSNVYAFIDRIVQMSNSKKINIVFYTLSKIKNTGNYYPFTPDWKKIKKDLEKLAKTRNVSAKITIVTSSDKNFPEHDRTIFTNYKYLYSGDTLNVQDSNQSIISKGRTLTIASLAKRKTMRDAMNFIGDMQKFTTYIEGLNNPDLIIGPGECRYIDFQKFTKH